MQAGGPIAGLSYSFVDPDSLKIIAFRVDGPLVHKSPESVLAVSSIREYSNLGCVIDSADELIEPSDVVKIDDIIRLNFNLVGLKVETKHGSHLGRIIDFTVTDDDFSVMQLIVKRPLRKSFLDPELTIPRSEIAEITDYKIIVKDEEKTIKERAMKEDFVPNYVNPFRTVEAAPAQLDSEDSSATSSRTNS